MNVIFFNKLRRTQFSSWQGNLKFIGLTNSHPRLLFEMTSRLPLLLFALLGFFALPLSAAVPQLKPVAYKGKNYVTLDSVQKFYGFPNLVRSGSKLILKNADTEIKFSVGGQEVLMNNVKFIFSDAIISSENGYLISRTDLVKLLDPILRPHYIKEAQLFDTVIIDPGHGGKDPGATNNYGTEAAYNLKIGLMLREHLQRAGFKVVMTRSDNRFLSLRERVNVANRYNNAVFVSIHFNSGSYRARGIETFTLSPVGVAHYGRSIKNSDFHEMQGNHQDSANIALATALHWGSLSSLKRRANLSIPDRGIRRARYSVLTGIKHPAVLIEGGFMSHPTEARIINSDSFQKTYAEALARSIAFYRKATCAKNPSASKR